MEECPICTKPILINIDNVKTPCRHAFCFSCIIKWIVENNSSCPLCRTNIYQKSIEPDLEIENLINTRNKAKYIFRRLLYCKYFFSTQDFNGRIYHSLIERNQYLNDISYGDGNYYEIVIKKDSGVYDLDYHETNYFGYFEEDFYVTSNNVRSYFFVVNIFDPRNIDDDFYSLAGNIKYERITINFKNIRHIYHIWPGYEC